MLPRRTWKVYPAANMAGRCWKISKKNVRKMVVELGKKNFIVWLINKHGDLR
jgi:hypothetical protein